jgi:hypothetical protein
VKSVFPSPESHAMPHTVGDATCETEWCNGGNGGYPKRCKCGGLIHAAFGDEHYEGYWLYEKCDQCGSDHEEA